MVDPRLSALLTKPVNDVLLDRAIRHAVFLERFKTGEVNKIVGFLNRDVFPDISKQVASRLSAIGTRGFDTGLHTTKRLRELEQTVAAQVSVGLRSANSKLAENMRAFALTESQIAARTMGDATKQWLSVDFNLPNVRTLNSIVSARPMQGALMRDWFKDLEAGTRRNIGRAINSGIALGETGEQIARRLTGTAANAFKDGVYQTTRRSAETIVRTSVNHVSSHAREETYKSNQDVVKAVQWVSTLDDRTTFICMGLDGKVFKIDQGDRPPAHPQCRSTTVPVLKSWKELGINLKEAPPNTRSALNGQVPEGTTYPKWFKEQPAAFQREVLGPGRYDLYRSGRITLDRFVDKTGRTLNLQELRRLEGLGTTTRKPRRQSKPKPANVKPAPPPEPPKNASGKEVRERVVKDGAARQVAVDDLSAKLKALTDEHAKLIVDERAFFNSRLKQSQRVDIFKQPELIKIKARRAEVLTEHRLAREQLELARARVRESVHKHLKVSNPTPIEWVNPEKFKRLRDKAWKSKAVEAREFLSQVTSKDALDRLNVDIVKIRKGSRAFATPGTVNVATDDAVRVFVHELGHTVEFADKGAAKRTVEFLWKRAAADPRGRRQLKRIVSGSGYGNGEYAWEDKFINPYIGKDYRRSAGLSVPQGELKLLPGAAPPPTEVLSMGVELLYADPVGFARKDPGMFDFIVDLLRGNP